LIAGRVLEQEFEEKTIHLGFGKRISSFHLDGVLCRQNHERVLQAMHLAANGYTLFLHGFQQGGLSLGRSAIDFVSQHNMSENGTALKLEDLSPGRMVGKDVGAGDVCRHEIRRNLYTRETKIQDLTEASHHERFSKPGPPPQQTVTAANQRDENLLDQR